MKRIDSRQVYLMDAGEYTKIGYATDPENQRSVIQSHNPAPVTLVGTIETDDARRLRETLHTRLAEYRCQAGGGGWFDLPDDIYTALARADYLSSINLGEDSTTPSREDREKRRRDRRMKRLRTPTTDQDGDPFTCRVPGCSEPANAVTVLSESTIYGALDICSEEWTVHLIAEDKCAHCFADVDAHEKYVDPDRLEQAGQEHENDLESGRGR